MNAMEVDDEALLNEMINNVDLELNQDHAQAGRQVVGQNGQGRGNNAANAVNVVRGNGDRRQVPVGQNRPGVNNRVIVGNAGQDIAAPEAQVEGNNPVDPGIQARGQNIDGVDAIVDGRFGQRLKEIIQDSENRAARAKRVYENLYGKYENNVRGGDGGRRGFYDNGDGRTSSTRDASYWKKQYFNLKNGRGNRGNKT